MSVVVEVLDEESTIADSLLLRFIVYIKTLHSMSYKVLENSGCIGSQPAIKYDQPSEDTKKQHGFFNA